MKKLTALITNDDGPRSPLLHPFCNALADQNYFERLHIVTPQLEQSWVSKSLTRFRDLSVFEHDFGGLPGYLVDGTPADAVSLGVHNIYPTKPDFVFSGINMGTNVGLPFYLSSGTVGAAEEAFLTGIRSIAFSVDLPIQVYQMWSNHDPQIYSAYAEDWKRLASLCVSISLDLVAHEGWTCADLFTINVPWGALPETKRTVTRVTRGKFEPLFIKTAENKFRHKLGGLSFQKELSSSFLPSDVEVLQRNEISISPIRFQLGSLEDEQLIEKLKIHPK